MHVKSCICCCPWYWHVSKPIMSMEGGGLGALDTTVEPSGGVVGLIQWNADSQRFHSLVDVVKDQYDGCSIILRLGCCCSCCKCLKPRLILGVYKQHQCLHSKKSVEYLDFWVYSRYMLSSYCLEESSVNSVKSVAQVQMLLCSVTVSKRDSVDDNICDLDLKRIYLACSL